jgi:hypothetical protein
MTMTLSPLAMKTSTLSFMSNQTGCLPLENLTKKSHFASFDSATGSNNFSFGVPPEATYCPTNKPVFALSKTPRL